MAQSDKAAINETVGRANGGSWWPGGGVEPLTTCFSGPGMLDDPRRGVVTLLAIDS
jgi:hypothetical protein